jgi:hypothetical protein
MQPILIEENVDLRQYPDLSERVGAVSSVTLGDLHGNALKLLYFLIREGVLSLAEKNQYADFLDIYSKNVDELSLEDIKAMRSIVKTSSVNNKIKVCLIGDELADRGSNDYFTILLLEKLHEARVNLEINISNHGLEFIYAVESGDFLNSGSLDIMPFQSGSIFALKKVAELYPELNILTEVTTFFNNAYKGVLRLISYDADIPNKKIIIRTHAPCDLDLIRDAANYLKIPYNDDSIQNLVTSLDAIQEKISEYIAQSSLTRLLQNYLLRFFLWNRNTESITDPYLSRKIDRQEQHHDFKIHYIHGHTPGISNHYITNLDTTLGKSQGGLTSYMSVPQIADFHHMGSYKVLRILI